MLNIQRDQTVDTEEERWPWVGSDLTNLSPILVPVSLPARERTSPVASSLGRRSTKFLSGCKTKLELALYSYCSERAAASAIFDHFSFGGETSF